MNGYIMAGMAIETPERVEQLQQRARLPESASVVSVEALVHTYYDALYRLALSILEDEEEAADATQETFIAAAKALDQFRGEASVKTWLFTIGVNQCRRIMRQRARQQKLLHAWQMVQSLVSRPVWPEETVAHDEREAQLRTAVSELNEKHRLPVILRYVHELTAPEIAQVLGINEGTVHSRLHYARRTLRQKLEGM